MSDAINYKLEYISELLLTMPRRIADELEKRHEIRKEMQVQEEIEFYSKHKDEINQFMYGSKKIDQTK